MVQGPSLAAMLQGAGSMGNPQDAVREATKRAFKRGTLGNAGIADGGEDPQLGAPGLPPHSGASGLGAMLAAVPLRRAQPGGNGDNWKSIPPVPPAPDSDPTKRPRRARRAPFRTRRNEYRRYQNDGVFRGKRNPYRNA